MSDRKAPSVAVVVGNPRAGSRTLAAARHVATRLSAAEPLVVDLATLGPRLLDPADPVVAQLVEQVMAADVVVAASPTYTATYTGLLKVFLDRLGHQALKDKVAVPLMLGGAPIHSLAPELLLRPVLTGLGAVVPVPALFVLETAYDDAATYDEWAVRGAVGARRARCPGSAAGLLAAPARHHSGPASADGRWGWRRRRRCGCLVAAAPRPCAGLSRTRMREVA